jgi:hypothetical protein
VCGGTFARPAPRDGNHGMGGETEPEGGWPLESVSFVVCVEEAKPQGGCISEKTGAEFRKQVRYKFNSESVIRSPFFGVFFFGTREAANDP